MLSLENVSVLFNAGTADENAALRCVNLEIMRGDFITVIGSNGAGKSTLYNAIAGSCIPNAGHIFLDFEGKHCDITHEKEYRRARYIGRIFQNPLLGTAGKMSLADNMMICCKKGWKGLHISLDAKKREFFRMQLSQLGMGLEERLNDNVEQFSGGQRQALTLLMAVLSHPALLLLDEHTAALDPENARAVMNLTRSFAHEYNLTVMMITHNMAHALGYGNRLLMMDSGQIILDVRGKEKAALKMDSIIRRFKEIKGENTASDEMILQ